MTHDELLAKIDNNYFPGFTHMEQVEEMVKQDTQIKAALRAVVELTRKYEEFEDVEVEKMQGYRLAMKQVIQAIEKELK